MGTRDTRILVNRIERLKAENRALRKKSASFGAENKELQRALRNRDILFDEFPDGIVLVKGERIIDVNRRVIDETGYQKDEIMGRSFLDLFHPKVRDQIRRFHKRRMAGKWAPELCQAEVLARNGDVLSCEMVVKRIRLNGQVAFLTRLSQIEERKKREKERVTSEKMKALTRMASALSRRLDQSVRAIRENTSSIKGLLDHEDKDLLGPVKDLECGTSQLSEIARDLEMLSRDKESFKATSLDLKELVRDTVTLMEPRIKAIEEEAKVRININKYFRAVSPIEGNPKEVRDVLISIIMNAVEAMPRGGDIYITTEENAGFAMVYIQDSGVGIPGRCLDKVFEPCFTLKSDGARGMGLSLAYAAVARHKGDIEIASKEGQGTTVLIKLPVLSKVGDKRERKRMAGIGNSSILIVEEEDMIRELLSQLLASKGFRVVSSDGFGDALNKLRKNPYHMVIADSQGQGSSAAGFFQRIIETNREISTILITGHAEDRESLSGKKPEADLVLSKPIDMDRLVHRVSDILIQKHDP